MPLTPQQIAKIQQKEATTPDALKRDPNVDYYHGWFFVTLNTRDNVPVLSVCAGNPAVTDGGNDAPRCLYTEIGKKVKECWLLIRKFHPDVVVDDCEVMPEHFHGLLYLPPTNRKHLGNIIYGFMVGCSHAYWDTLGIDWRNMKDDSAIAHKWQDRDHTMSYRGPALFVHGYNDMEPITEEEVEIKRAYIRDQAKKRLIQGDRHECFKKHRHAHSDNWTVERCINAVVVDRTFRYDMTKRERAMLNVLGRLNRDMPPALDTSVTTFPSGKQVGMPNIGLDYIGNKALLYSDKKLPLVCHSADAGRFEEQKAAVLDAARKEWVIVSAFISEKERDIKTQLMIEQLPFIDIMDNGFSDRYKGIGKAFYALAENRLLQITPWNYLYQKKTPIATEQKKVSTISREICLVMNELAITISGRGDDWWKSIK